MTLRKLKLKCDALGATVEDIKIGNTHECTVFAPKGKFWSEGSVHLLVDCTYRPWKPDYDGLVSRMDYGLEDCTDSECEWCYEKD